MSRRGSNSRSKRTEVERLHLFRSEVDTLRQRRLVKDGLYMKSEMSWNAHDQELHIQMTKYDEEDLRSYLTALRPFYSDDSDIFVNKIHSILYQMTEDEHVRRLLARGRARWNEIRQSNGMLIEVNGKILTPEYIYDLWMNGRFFHHDADKRKELTDLPPLARHEVWKEFINYIIAATDHVIWLSHTMEKVIRDGLIDIEASEEA